MFTLCCCSTSIGSNDLPDSAPCQYQDDEFILHQVSVELADYFIVMQVDKASWHRSKYLKIPENIRLIHQPSYSPQLMPVEHIWEEIKENHFYNHVFPSLDKVEDELSQGLLELCSEPDRLRSLTFFLI